MIRVPRSVTNFSNLHYEIRGFFEMKRRVRIDVTEHDPPLNVDAPVTTTSLLVIILRYRRPTWHTDMRGLTKSQQFQPAQNPPSVTSG
uniref:Uncharacterized protein n=1 Tax=Agrobacterium larrymoorei TaxID=160699 RepID=A0A2Z2Q4J5_9HYPH|nr:hypothetical protein [Agrobacterium larrymoorei]